jgi:hypothetical protein
VSLGTGQQLANNNLMSKKTKIILILIFILIIAIVGFLLYKSKTEEPVINPITNKPFDPFGTNEPQNNTDGDGNNTGIDWTDNTLQENSKFHQLTDFAVAGASFFENPQITTGADNIKTEILTPTLRYVERSTGHVHQMELDTKETIKVSNSTIPNVYEVLINKVANTFIYRYLGSDSQIITTFIAKLGDSKGEFLPSNITEMSLSPDKTKTFYMVKNSDGVIGFTLSLDDNKKSQIFTSPFSEWLSQWATNQKIYLTTKPSYAVSGSLFGLDITSGTLTKIFGGIEGLTTLSNSNGLKVLYGASLDTGPKLGIFDAVEHSTKDLDTYGLPEKCIWSKDDISVYCAVPNLVRGTEYPDVWYQGLISFDDFFVKINTETGEKTTLANSKNEVPVDATHLFLDQKESNLFFINKKNSTLWSLDL